MLVLNKAGGLHCGAVAELDHFPFAGTDERKMITFYVSAKKHAALKAYCKQEGRTMTAVMQNAVDELLKEAENEDR